MASSSILGRAVKRVEDPRFLSGRGGYIGNRDAAGALHLATARSTVPHGRIIDIDTSDAAAAPGVVGVFTADDLDLRPVPAVVKEVREACARPPIAADVVRFAGEVVAVVVAESARQAADAADLVWADIDPLPAVADVAAAVSPDAPLLFPDLGTNVVYHRERAAGSDPLEGADVVVSATVRNQRLAAVPMEAGNALAFPTSDGVELWAGSQDVFGHRRKVADSLGLENEKVRTRVPDMGGGFGAKFTAYPEQILCAALARKLGRPVRWEQGRRDNLTTMYHGRAQVQHVELAATRDGDIVGLTLQVDQDAGAYPAWGAWLPVLTLRMACGVYDIPNVRLAFDSVVTNTTPTDSYRGAGRPEATALIERAVDILADELHMDPAELRRRNFLPADDFPVTTATGARYDSGDYEAALATALELAGYDELRTEQQHRRASGARKQLGIGLSTYVEITAGRGDSEWSSIEIHKDGTASVKVGTSSHGQGHETAFAQLVSDVLKIPHTDIRVLQGDTGIIARGSGTGGSRSLQIGGSSVLRSGRAMLDKAKRIVADHYEAAPEDIVLADDGLLRVAGVPDTAMSWGEVAELTVTEEEAGGDAGSLYVDDVFEQEEATFPFGAHVSVVEVDTETGETEVLRHIAVDDCGTILNPVLVDGQVHGGVAQGYGQALIEGVVYDGDANLMTGTLVSYLIPTAPMLPSFEVAHTQTPTPLNPLGVKGVGEAGTIGSTPAVQNAVIDAISHLGVTHVDMPLTPGAVWGAIQAATSGGH